MALTPEGTPYVESSDLVANYPAASLALANRVDLVGVLPFANAAARTTAIPTPTDGQYSYLQDTNTTQFYNGSAWVNAGGKILQVVSVTKTDTFTTTSTTFTDITGLSVSITPSATTSRILIMGNLAAQGTAGSSATMFRMMRDATPIAISDAAGNRDRTLGMNEANSFTTQFNSTTFLDSPNTVSATIYKFQIRSAQTSQTSFVNRTQTDTDALVYGRAVSSITLLEVSA